MKKKEKIVDLLTKISDKLCKSDIKNFIRDDANAIQLINYEETNKIGYAVFLKNDLSHIIIWYDMEEDDSYFQMGTAKLASGALTIRYLLSQAN